MFQTIYPFLLFVLLPNFFHKTPTLFSLTLFSTTHQLHTKLLSKTMNTNPSWSQNLSTHRKIAIQHLIHGRELANQLQMVLHGNPSAPSGSVVVANELVMKIMGSFTDTISILNPTVTGEVFQAPVGCRRKREEVKTEDSEESSKTSVLKDRRGTYKRRRTTETWTKDTPTLADDGHAWRKYGQKIIHHAKYPRNYYRCTHKFDLGYQATKQVQRTQEEPVMYKMIG